MHIFFMIITFHRRLKFNKYTNAMNLLKRVLDHSVNINRHHIRN